MTTITIPIAVDSTEGGRPFCYFCVGCGDHEHTADGKAYFYRDEQGAQQFVCWDCVRTDKNPNYVRTDSSGRVI